MPDTQRLSNYRLRPYKANAASIPTIAKYERPITLDAAPVNFGMLGRVVVDECNVCVVVDEWDVWVQVQPAAVLEAVVEEFKDVVVVMIEAVTLGIVDLAVLAVIEELLVEVVEILNDCGAKYPLQNPWTHVFVEHWLSLWHAAWKLPQVKIVQSVTP